MLKAFIHCQQHKSSARIIAIHSILKFVEINSSKANKTQETSKRMQSKNQEMHNSWMTMKKNDWYPHIHAKNLEKLLYYMPKCTFKNKNY